MSLINVNKNYLKTMGIAEEDPQVGVIVAVYYIGCSIGAVLFSWLADRFGRRAGLFGCLATCSLGNLICFIAGLGFSQGALPVMYAGRIIMGVGVGKTLSARRLRRPQNVRMLTCLHRWRGFCGPYIQL
jgi:MFS family permease